MTNALSRLLETRDWLLTDGATGTNLFNMGLTSGDATELWNARGLWLRAFRFVAANLGCSRFAPLERIAARRHFEHLSLHVLHAAFPIVIHK